MVLASAVKYFLFLSNDIITVMFNKITVVAITENKSKKTFLFWKLH
jgi:hypothetical protein